MPVHELEVWSVVSIRLSCQLRPYSSPRRPSADRLVYNASMLQTSSSPIPSKASPLSPDFAQVPMQLRLAFEYPLDDSLDHAALVALYGRIKVFELTVGL